MTEQIADSYEGSVVSWRHRFNGRYLMPVFCLFFWGFIADCWFSHVSADKSEAVILDRDFSGATMSGFSGLMLGDLRGFVADMFWLQTYVAWRQEDYAKTNLLIGMTCRIDPQNERMWIRGGDMIAMDMVGWKMDAYEKVYGHVPEIEIRKIFSEQGRLALMHYREAIVVLPRRYHGDILLQMAQVYLNRMEDRDSAVEYFKLAAWAGARPFAAFQATRILYNDGRPEEAERFLKQYVNEFSKGFTETQSIEAKRLIDGIEAREEDI